MADSEIPAAGNDRDAAISQAKRVQAEAEACGDASAAKAAQREVDKLRTREQHEAAAEARAAAGVAREDKPQERSGSPQRSTTEKK